MSFLHLYLEEEVAVADEEGVVAIIFEIEPLEVALEEVVVAEVEMELLSHPDEVEQEVAVAQELTMGSLLPLQQKFLLQPSAMVVEEESV